MQRTDARTPRGSALRGRAHVGGHGFPGSPQPNRLQAYHHFPLDTFTIGELVLAKNVNRPQPFWPVSGPGGACPAPCARNEGKTCPRLPERWDPLLQAIVVEPSKDAPESVRRMMQPGKLCVMFYGPAANKVSASFVSLPSRTCR